LIVDQSYVNEILSYNPCTGDVTRRVRTSNCVNIGDIVRSPDKDGYYRISINGKRYKLHSIIWLMVHGTMPTFEIDHINGKVSDNRLVNLRDVPHIVNSRNRRLNVKNTSGHTGIQLSPSGKYIAFVTVNQERLYLGTFITKGEAVAVRRDANRKYGFSDRHGQRSKV